MNNCYDIKTGIVYSNDNDALCGNKLAKTCDVFNEDGKEFVCGKMLDNPDWGNCNFDNIVSSFMMVFLTVTLESWSIIMIRVFNTTNYYVLLYFIVLVLIGGFFIVNLMLAVITIHFIFQQKVTSKNFQQMI